MAQPLNTQTIKGGIKRVTQFIQDDKVAISQKTIVYASLVAAIMLLVTSSMGVKKKGSAKADGVAFIVAKNLSGFL